MTRPPHTNPIIAGSGEEIVGKLKPALKLLPIECHDTPDYAEATGPQFRAMTMVPEAFLALRALPEAIAFIEAQQATYRGLVEALVEGRAVIAELLGPLDRAAAELSDMGNKLDKNAQAAFDRAYAALANIDHALSIVRVEPSAASGAGE